MDRPAQKPDESGGKSAKPPVSQSSSSSTSGFAGLGVQFLVVILLFLFGGKWLDARLGTAPWLLILGVFVGAGTGMFVMYRRVFPPEKPAPPPAKPPVL